MFPTGITYSRIPPIEYVASKVEHFELYNFCFNGTKQNTKFKKLNFNNTSSTVFHSAYYIRKL